MFFLGHLVVILLPAQNLVSSDSFLPFQGCQFKGKDGVSTDKEKGRTESEEMYPKRDDGDDETTNGTGE